MSATTTDVQEGDLTEVVDTAEREATEADGLVEALEERVLSGDTGVGREEFEEAQGLAKFARKRAEGARRRKAAAEAAQLVEATATLVERFEAATATRSQVHGPGLEKFEAAVQEAAEEWMRSARGCDRQIREVVVEANSLDIAKYNVGQPQDAGPRKGWDRVAITGRPDLIIGESSRHVLRYLTGAETESNLLASLAGRLERDRGDV